MCVCGGGGVGEGVKRQATPSLGHQNQSIREGKKQISARNATSSAVHVGGGRRRETEGKLATLLEEGGKEEGDEGGGGRGGGEKITRS